MLETVGCMVLLICCLLSFIMCMDEMRTNYLIRRREEEKELEREEKENLRKGVNR